jgi:multiple sugar transport system ATP-binding protein
MPALVLRNVTKAYGNLVAVDQLSLEVEEGELVVVLGPAGAGKTSILKMISRIEEITRGEIWIGDDKVNNLDPDELDVAMIFETYALYPHRTVFENIASPLLAKSRAASRSEIVRKVNETATLLDISGLLHRYPSELSGGQKQRVSLGRALIRQPRVFLMDEPISHLDSKLRHQMRRELKKLKGRLGAAVVYVTHDYLEALSLADRIVVLDRGQVVQIGLPSEVYYKPNDIFVASLLGHPQMNLIEGQIVEELEQMSFVSRDGGIRIPIFPELRASFRRQRTQKLVAGIRPAHVSFSEEPIPGSIPALRYATENIGNKSALCFKAGQTKIRGLVTGAIRSERKKDVFITIPPRKVIYFLQSGRRIGTEENLGGRYPA